MKVFESFAGIGTQHMALKKLGIPFEIVAISEIDEYAIKSYEAIHGKANNLGDISKIEVKDVPDHDLLTYSFPCQDISLGGKLDGFSEEDETRSSLLWQAMRIAKEKKPKYMVAENVKNLLSKRFKEDFDKWINYLDKIGYNTYYGILNSLNYGIPQNRERAFVISIRKDINKKFKMPEPILLESCLLDFLEDKVDESEYTNPRIHNALVLGGDDTHIKIKNATKLGYLEAVHGDGIDFAYTGSKTRRGRVQAQRSHTLNTEGNIGVIVRENGVFRSRRFALLEYWRLMGIADDDFYKAQKATILIKQLYKQAGNAIVVDVLYHIFRELLVENGSH